MPDHGFHGELVGKKRKAHVIDLSKEGTGSEQRVILTKGIFVVEDL